MSVLKDTHRVSIKEVLMHGGSAVKMLGLSVGRSAARQFETLVRVMECAPVTALAPASLAV